MAGWEKDETQCNSRAIYFARAEEGIASINYEQQESSNSGSRAIT